jgi:predicted ATPase
VTGGDRLLGRTHALAALDEAVAAARAGRGGLLLVGGDAGIGKTALAGQVLRSGPGRGLLVVWAACASGAGTPGYWPWIQVLRGVVGSHPDEPLAEQLRTARVLLLGTYRDAEARPLLRELARGARVVPLSGLDEPATAELMERVAGRPTRPSRTRCGCGPAATRSSPAR